MKKIIIVLILFFTVTSSSFASSFDAFNSMLNAAPTDAVAEQLLNNLSSDMGSLMLGGNIGVSASLGLSKIRFNLKVSGTQMGSEIMRASDSELLYMPIIHAEFGLPYRIDLIGRYGFGYDSNIYGLGARYGLYESQLIVIPSVSVQGLYSMMATRSNGNDFDANNISLSTVATFDQLPFVMPYAGIGWSKTSLTPKSSNRQNITGTNTTMGYTLGMAASILMINADVSVTWYDMIPNYTLSISAGF
ncbi:MAG: hypothetical protein PHI20_03740 [Endomicrobiaceae bacterium]|jgi:hypothetical protein|nr:hypothetical protein [Endomicrobiaceae bacterium]MDD4166125.1 hypothetical protein [Endomicrobiaceae bacterium]